MKVLIISDTHGKSSCLKQIHDIVGDVDMLIHLGDVEGDEKLIHDLFDCEIHMVRGNCDYNPLADFEHLRAEWGELAGLKFQQQFERLARQEDIYNPWTQVQCEQRNLLSGGTHRSGGI